MVCPYLHTEVSHLVPYRFVNRSVQFREAYRLGLDGPQAAWAAKKYRGHRTIPVTIMEELNKAQIGRGGNIIHENGN